VSYEITQPRFEHVESALRARIRAPWPDARPNADIRPPNPVPAIRNDAEGFAVVVSMRWGLLPYWSKEPKAQYASFNARAETIDSQPMFRIPFQQRHCLIPAHGWLEWPVSERGKHDDALVCLIAATLRSPACGITGSVPAK
jgi:putative SOS response-associated peptidase YedK